ncbi:MAG: hypothetical protein ABI981_02855 [Betaproteobacteria bacterium]
MPTVLRLLFAAACLLAGNVWAQNTMSVIPAVPRYMEPVYLRISPGAFSGRNGYGATASMSGNKITVRFFAVIDIGQYDYDVELGRFPAGTYSVEVTGALTIPQVEFTVAASAIPSQLTQPGDVPAVNYSDFWWNEAESGWGLSIQQGPTNKLFAAWFVYDATGKPVWYTLEPGRWTTANIYTTYTGPVYKTSGPYFGGPFDPSQVGIVQVGTGELSFRNANSGTFRYTIEGVTGVKTITRMPVE